MTASFRLVIALFLAVTALVPARAVAAKHRAAPAHATESATPYKGAIIMDAATGKVLFEDHADEVNPPASMTKLMTFAVVCDKLADHTITLATPVDISVADYKMGGTQVYLDPKETFPVEELIYAMMIQSANDAAHALARASAGSIEAFVDLMNAKARSLGMTHTTFRTPHGLPPASRRIADGDLTTPRDFALLSRYLLLKTDVLKYTSVRMRKFGEGIRPPDKVITMVNHDHLLEKVAGVDGLKTGFTNGAGFCLSATAERNHHRVIVVVMGSPTSKERDFKVTEFIDHGFAAIPADSPPFAQNVNPVVLASPVTAAPLPAGEKKPAESASPVITFPPPKK